MRLIVGDSHVRSYVDSNVLNHAVFLGPGKEVNFVSMGSMLSYLMRLLVLKNCLRDRSNISIALIVGEPDVRFACYEGWWVDNKQIISEGRIESRIEKSLGRVDWVLGILQRRLILPCDLVIGVGTPKTALFPYALQFNSRLRLICERRGIPFFDPQACVEMNDSVSSYRTVSVMNPVVPDNTHLSKRIGQDLSRNAKELKLDTVETKPLANAPNRSSAIQYFEDFESHRMKYGTLVKILLKTLKTL